MPLGEIYNISLVVLANWAVAIGTTLLNKWLHSYEESLEVLLLTILWLQSLTAVLISSLIMICQAYIFRDPTMPAPINIFKGVKVKETVILSLFSIISLLFNTVILKYYSIALFTISRTLATVFTVAFTSCILKEATPPPVLIAIALIAIGYITSISADQFTSDLRIKSIVYSTIAGIGVALRAVFTRLGKESLLLKHKRLRLVRKLQLIK